MENKDNIVMSRIAFERMQAKDEKNDRWRNITIIVLIVLDELMEAVKALQPSLYAATIDKLKE